MDIKILTFNEGDEETWLRIINDSIEGSKREPLKQEDIERYKRSPYFDPKGVFFAYVKGTAVGVCWAASGEFYEVEKGHFNTFQILPEYSGTEVESILHRCAIDYFKSKGLKEVEASFTDDDSYKQSFFSSQGYRVDRVYLIMKKDVKDATAFEPMSGVVVQPLKKGQLRMLVDVANKSFSDAFSYYDFEASTVEQLEKQMQMYDVSYDDVKIAFLNSGPVGYVYIIKDQVSGIGVVKEHRRKGVASALLLEGLKQIRSKGFEEASTGVSDANIPALNFFRKQGFQEAKKLVFMKKTLKEDTQT